MRSKRIMNLNKRYKAEHRIRLRRTVFQHLPDMVVDGNASQGITCRGAAAKSTLNGPISALVLALNIQRTGEH